MHLALLPWMILLLPLAAAVGITLSGLQDERRSAKWSIGAVLTGFLLTLLFILVNGWQPSPAVWISMVCYTLRKMLGNLPGINVCLEPSPSCSHKTACEIRLENAVRGGSIIIQ